MKFLLNENITPLLKNHIGLLGHECFHIYECGLSGKSDEEVIVYEVENKMSIITHDLDYGRIITLSGKAGPSVIAFRHKKISLAIIRDSLTKVLPIYLDRLNEGALISIDEETIRHRALPFQRD